MFTASRSSGSSTFSSSHSSAVISSNARAAALGRCSGSCRSCCSRRCRRRIMSSNPAKTCAGSRSRLAARAGRTASDGVPPPFGPPASVRAPGRSSDVDMPGVDELSAVLCDLTVAESAHRPATPTQPAIACLEHIRKDALLPETVGAGQSGKPCSHDHNPSAVTHLMASPCAPLASGRRGRHPGYRCHQRDPCTGRRRSRQEGASRLARGGHRTRLGGANLNRTPSQHPLNWIPGTRHDPSPVGCAASLRPGEADCNSVNHACLLPLRAGNV